MDWFIKHSLTSTKPPQRRAEILAALYQARGLNNPEAIDTFIHPPDPLTLSPNAVGLDPKSLQSAINSILAAINHQQPISTYGDYDADGVTATAILWETLFALGAKVHPFIPSREHHGYGLSTKGLSEILRHFPIESEKSHPLVITVDNGISAFEAASYLQALNIDLIITDHHQPGPILPLCQALVHTVQLSGAGVAWFLAKELVKHFPSQSQLPQSTLDLCTIGTIADMLPLLGPNRSLVKAGLISLRQTSRPGLKALYAAADLDEITNLTPYHVNFILAPRINAMGRLENAIDSLRLLCTHDSQKANTLAALLDQTNITRQDLTQTLLDQAINLVTDPQSPVLVIDHPDFHEGVIGLVAGKLAEIYYRPTIIISRHQSVSKASARSVKGINIIELIRQHETLLINAGGHPMAAGFSLQTDQIDNFRREITITAKTQIDPQLLIPSLSIDCALSSLDITPKLFQHLQILKPFGIGNPEPVFCFDDARIIDSRIVGKNQKHLKLTLQTKSGGILPAIGFNLAKLSNHQITPPPQIAFTLAENTWNGRTSLQLILKDIKVSI